jgi:rhodanese-related sulfurtransferase
MAANNGVRPLLIDARTREEYEVSHPPEAVWAETPQQIASALREASDGQAVVLYCSVGLRSSKAAATLVRSGRTNVFNLQGSIFQWANEGRPLIANDRAVHVVHPYDERWGVLLNPQLHPLKFAHEREQHLVAESDVASDSRADRLFIDEKSFGPAHPMVAIRQAVL